MLNVPDRARNNSAVGGFWGAAEISGRRGGEDIQSPNKNHAGQYRYQHFLKNITRLDRPIFNLSVGQHAINRAPSKPPGPDAIPLPDRVQERRGRTYALV